MLPVGGLGPQTQKWAWNPGGEGRGGSGRGEQVLAARYRPLQAVMLKPGAGLGLMQEEAFGAPR